ncbi:beta strand repeat-containing protein [Verrucomicrobium spinosum]|uniref:beta strand repeat-containing protein n=1 Tax=Verrucomicrobium spinosum TaxID=2736 RepID=UPI0001745277|nr:autotransporter-associated beta strand repeat-containing protein [Verrucomicrobium spinosum]
MIHPLRFRPDPVFRAGLLALSAFALFGSLKTAHAQWSGAAGNGIYNDVNNWTGGSINGAFTTVAPPASLLFDADITTSINIQIDTAGAGTTLAGSGGTRTITLNGNLQASGTGVDTTITIANSLILDLNGATRTFGNTSTTGVWNIDAKITGNAGVILGGGTGTVNLNNTANDFTGNVTFNRRGGNFTSIADAGVASALGAGSSITVNDGVSFGSLNYTGGAASSNRSWTWNNGGSSYAFNQNGSGTLTLTGNWNFTSGTAITFGINASTADLVLEGVINGNDNFTFGGAAVKSLKGVNTFSGTVTLNAGTLEFNSVADSGTASALGQGTIINAGNAAAAVTLRYSGTEAGGHSTNRTLNLSGTAGSGVTLEANGTGALKFTADSTATGAGAKTLTLGGTSATGVQNEFQGAIVNGSGTTSVTKTGSNEWTISGTNTYTGLTTVSGGTLTVKGDQSAATGGYLLNASTASALDFASGATINAIAGKSISVATGASVNLTLSSAATVTNAGTLSLGRGALLNMTAGTWAQSGALSVTGNGGFNGRLSITGGVFTYTGSSASIGFDGSTGSLVAVSGTGELRFQGTGDVAVGRGVVSASSNVAGEITVGAGGTVVTQQKFVQNVEEGRINLSGGTVKLSANLADFSDNLALVLSTATATRFDTNGFTTAIDDVISGTGVGGLDKQGTGNLKLSGGNTYTGGTRVSGGMLTANHVNALGSGAVTITSGVSLKVGDGAAGQQLVFGSTLVNDGSILMDLFSTSGSSGLDTASSDYLTFNGAFSGDLGNITLTNLSGSEAFAVGAKFHLVDWSAVTAGIAERSFSFSYDSSFAGLGSAYTFDESSFLSGGYITVAAVPEPGKAVLLLLGGLGILRRRRLQKQGAC